MLLERATGLAAKIDRYQKLKAAAHESEKFRTRAAQFGKAADKVRRTSAALRRYEEAGVDVPFLPKDAEGLAAKAQVLRDALSASPAALTDPPFDLKYEFVDRLHGLADGADKSMAEAWRRYVGRHGALGQEDVLDTLSVLPQFRTGITRIRRCRAEVAALGNAPLSDPKAAVARLVDLMAEHRTAWAELTADDIPREVLAFIRACAGDGAPVSALTDEVRSWLGSRNLIGAFRIKIR